ncbi:hypothetical protein NKG94_21315 [Micromonospora sp. M12]
MILLHGWPYDIHSFADVVPLLTAAGHRVVVPYLRATARPGSSPTTPCGTANRRPSRSTSSPSWTPWGSTARSWPDSTGRAHGRCRGRPVARALPRAGLGERLPDRRPGIGQVPLPPKAELAWWYQYYFATERGRQGTTGTDATSPG